MNNMYGYGYGYGGFFPFGYFYPNMYGMENFYGPISSCPYCNNQEFINKYNPYQNKTNIMHTNYSNRLLPEERQELILKDYMNKPFVINIENATKQNDNYRLVLWTGKYLQVTLMCINENDDIGLEIHEDTDQFLRIESGKGIVKMGKSRDKLEFEKYVGANDAIFVPANTWHNVINTSNMPLKLYSIYAPPHHKAGGIYKTKQIAQLEE